ncbi:copper amine oxidase N-terminal domain-containing protein [Paenibacillus sp. MBLB4367]|uniref:copper amine oxidase N-terminal domain-containing protein n=1 Tax=Paenibacillus sp. MBLB4367 TaxID=3384767 RepID=UPI003907F3A2
MRKGKMAVLCAVLSLLLLALTGCQTIGGVDLNKALSSGAEVKSSEGSASITLELLGNGKANAENTNMLKYIELLKKLTINLTEIKTESPDLTSAKGEIVYAGGKIPVTLSIGKEKLAVLFEGATKPYVLNLNETISLKKLIPYDLPLDALGGNPIAVISKLMPFIAKSLPNPSVITVDKATETINNEPVSLNKVHAEIKGPEVAGLIKQFIGNVLADEEGLRGLVKLFLNQGSEQGGFDFSGVAVEFIKPILQDLQSNIDKQLAGSEFINDKFTLKTDLFYDGDLHQRKTNFELGLSLPDLEQDGFTGFKVTGTMDKWNLNKPVTARAVDVSKGALEQTDKTKMAHFIKTLEPKSTLYGLLVNDLQILKKEIHLQMSADGAHVPDTLNPFIKQDNTMVPVRFVTERLDADVEWNNDTREVTVTDIMTGKTVVLAIDSKKVLVDGQQLKAADEPEVAPEIVEGSTYVPGAWLARLFGATTEWNNDTRTVTIKKN